MLLQKGVAFYFGGLIMNMTECELQGLVKQYLKEYLTVEITVNSDDTGYTKVRVGLYLEGEFICEASDRDGSMY